MATEKKSNPERKDATSAASWREAKRDKNSSRPKQTFEKGKGWSR
jgi:hypothetical protein